MLSPKVNVVGVIYQNSFGERYYSKYFTKHCPSVLREPFNLETFEGQRRFEKALLDKVARMNVVSKLKPEQGNSYPTQSKSSRSAKQKCYLKSSTNFKFIYSAKRRKTTL
jgi:hypothetical protein